MRKISISDTLVAIFLIIFGIFLIFNLNANYVWSVILIVLGLGFEFGAFGKSTGRFIPGGILTTIGLLLLFCTFKGFSYMVYLWPVFVMAPAVGMIQTYFASRSKGVLVGSIILFSISAILFGISLYQSRMIFGTLVVIFGIIMLVASRKK